MLPIDSSPPILYSLQHCPYAMRARIAIFKSQRDVLIRAIKLNNKPEEMLSASPKGSVPVLVVNQHGASEGGVIGKSPMVIEESLEVMIWALAKNDPQDLIHNEQQGALPTMVREISQFEHAFVPAMEAYSCAKRYHDDNLKECREACEAYLAKLEQRLNRHTFLFSDRESLLDIAIMPFIRKFARIERQWYLQSPYPKLRAWLDGYLQSRMFSKVMANHELWLDTKTNVFFGNE
ncbi:glutathione S-transferase [Vibrio sp. E150_011]